PTTTSAAVKRPGQGPVRRRSRGLRRASPRGPSWRGRRHPHPAAGAAAPARPPARPPPPAPRAAASRAARTYSRRRTPSAGDRPHIARGDPARPAGPGIGADPRHWRFHVAGGAAARPVDDADAAGHLIAVADPAARPPR